MDGTGRPASGEYHPYYETYVSLVGPGSITATLEANASETLDLLGRIPEDRANLAYAPGKWTLKQVVGHMSDTERVFAYRLLRAARGDTTRLAGFDQDPWAGAWDVTGVPLASLVAEFGAVRASTLFLLRHLGPDDWTRRVNASEADVSVRALAFMIAGHELHHMGVLKREYLGQ